MERPEHEVPGCRGFDGQANGFYVPHFAHQNDIRIFSKRAPESRGKRLGVQPHLPMVDNAPVTLVHKLDWVFDGNNVILPVFMQNPFKYVS